MGGYLQSDTEIDWSGSRRWTGDILSAYADRCEKSQRLTELLAGVPFVVGGDEHHIFSVEADPERVYKATFGDNFGAHSAFYTQDPEMIGRHFYASCNANPLFYLTRWLLLNSLGGYQTRYEGILPPERDGWLPRICVSQPRLPIANPSRGEIRAAMEEYGFRELCEDAYLDPESGLLLTDAAPRNVRVLNGAPVPFDTIAEIAAPRVLEWAAARLGISME